MGKNCSFMIQLSIPRCTVGSMRWKGLAAGLLNIEGYQGQGTSSQDRTARPPKCWSVGVKLLATHTDALRACVYSGPPAPGRRRGGDEPRASARGAAAWLPTRSSGTPRMAA